MKISFLIPGGVDREGARNVVPCFLALMEWLVRNGDEVHVFTLYQEREAAHWTLRGAHVHNAGGARPALRMFAQLVAEQRRAPFDVIQTNWSQNANLVGAAARSIFRVPLVLHLGGGELIDIPDIRYGGQHTVKSRTLLRLATRSARHIAVQSNPLVDEARELNLAATRLPFGVALDTWPVLTPRRRPAARPLRLLHVGNIVPVKDHRMLLNMAVSLRARGVRFELDIVGEDVSGRSEMQALARRLGLLPAVRFHGALLHGEVRRLNEGADILLVTSRHEAGPIVALEAAVAGVAVVGTHVGHLVEWAPSGARTVAPGDADGLAAIVAGLDGNEEARLELAANAQRRAVAENADHTSREFRALYAKLSGS